MTQNAAILHHLRKHKSITPLEALKHYGCFRLGARIWELKREGYKIGSYLISQNGKYFSRYYIVK